MSCGTCSGCGCKRVRTQSVNGYQYDVPAKLVQQFESMDADITNRQAFDTLFEQYRVK